MPSTIVFSQTELEKALENGFSDIILCDSTFVIPLTGGIFYTAVGNVSVTADGDCDAFCEAGVEFHGFTPKFTKKSPKKFANVPRKMMSLSSSGGGSFSSSYRLGSFASSYRFKSSYRTSYRTSFTSSYRLASSFRTSYRTSFTTSYRLASSYRTSYRTSFASSYKFTSSYRSSYRGSFGAGFVSKALSSFAHRAVLRAEIAVNGYGIHLI